MSDETTRDEYTVVLEDIQSKINLILEAVEPIPKMQETLDATFEEVGNLRTDMEVVKETIKDHSQQINVLQNRG